MAVVMNSELERNDEATARQLCSTLMEKYPTLNVSLSTMKHQRKQLGWVCTRPHYCQLIQELNKLKRLVWCKKQLRAKEDFSNVIFSDECIIQLEYHSRFCFRKTATSKALTSPQAPCKASHLGSNIIPWCSFHGYVHWHNGSNTFW